jgi:hypothetical protein
MTRRFAASLALGFCLSFLVPAASANGIIFTNFGLGQTYNTTVGDQIGNFFDGNNYAEGSTFTSSLTSTFGSLDIALSCFFTCPDPFTVALTQDGGDQPGTVIESFAVPGISLGVFGVNNPLVVLNSLLHPILTIGTQYWVTVSSGLNNSITWNLNSIGDTSDQAISVDGSATWFSPSGLTPGAYEVDSLSTTTVPEPGSMWMLLVPALTLCLRRRAPNSRPTSSES